MRTVFALLVCAALCSAEPETVYIEQAQGLLLIGSFEDVVDGSLRSVKGLHAADVDIPGGVVPLEKVLNPIYLDQPVGPETISQLKQAIATYYRNYGRPIVSVLVPEQDVTDGVLQLVVTEGRVGKVSVEGNRWFSSERLEDYMSLKPDEFIDEDKLIADLGFINRNPFRRADVIYAPGEEPGQTDIRLLTADRFPLRVFAGGENSGVYATGRQRWVGGFVWANAWGLDHVMSFQYSTSANFNKFQSYSGSYEIPLPWKHAASISGGFSEVHATIRSFRQMANHGNSAQISGRYRIPMRHRIGWEGELSFGADWKRTNNTVEFGGLSQPVIAQNANLFQIAAAYSGGIEYSFLRLSMDVEIFGSPFEFLPNQSTAVYDALVPEQTSATCTGKALGPSFSACRRIFPFPSSHAASSLPATSCRWSNTASAATTPSADTKSASSTTNRPSSLQQNSGLPPSASSSATKPKSTTASSSSPSATGDGAPTIPKFKAPPTPTPSPAPAPEPATASRTGSPPGSTWATKSAPRSHSPAVRPCSTSR